MKNMVILSNRV